VSKFHSTYRQVYLFLVTVILCGPGCVAAQIPDVAGAPQWDVQIPAAAEPISITSASTKIECAWTQPITRPALPKNQTWVHNNRTRRQHVLADHVGELTADTFTTPTMELLREVWVDKDRDAVAIRLRLTNRGSEEVQLDALVPFRCKDQASLNLQDTQADDWGVLVQQRLKNGQPTSMRPHKAEEVECDPFCLIRPDNKVNALTLLAGYISQLGHCARIMLNFEANDGGALLKSMTAECEFDGCLLPPGGQRTSQWACLQIGPDASDLMTDFADRQARYHGIKPPTRSAPSVWCSWYYYGPGFTEKDYLEDLAYLQKDHVPFDVFLIDDCWEMAYGDWLANDAWPSGMKAIADRIREVGYVPGLWTCPYLLGRDSQIVKEHPEWRLKFEDSTFHTFPRDKSNFVLDPTYPGACDFLEKLYRRLTHDCGFTYHKMDFMRAVFLDKRVNFYNPNVTRLEAYRLGLEAIRRGCGPDAYISVCGGHFGGSIGIADSQRSGSDVGTQWKDNALVRFKQNILRTWMGRLWHTDADAMMVRRRESVPEDIPFGKFRLGRFNDDEARTVALNQYFTGGLVCLTEKFQEMSADRKSLYHHVIPSIGAGAIALDPIEPICPSRLLTRVTPNCDTLTPWVTLTVVNWTDEPKSFSVELASKVLETVPGNRVLVSEFFSQKILGVYRAGLTVELGELAPHGGRLLRITAWDGENPVLAGTDLHFSGGGAEIVQWQTAKGSVSGVISTAWNTPVRVTVAFPAEGGFVERSTVVEPGQNSFQIARP